ncbi:cysteine-rich motor neuron 1 protein-like isoform X2 [Bolinopsis microptera]|uniref:cysteine-rich motor neuron 1 protein-like isoform X2 n=1 Tax=Bolinopsis microptera TaxID=2820187 RepID=UPI00307A4EC1
MRNAVFTITLAGLFVGSLSLCGECDNSLCPDNGSCNVTTLDECGCCNVCVRGINEKCGGAYGKYGVCQRGLECVEEAEEIAFVGICKDNTGNPDCSKVSCPEITFECPWDSLYIPSPDSNSSNSCCKIPGRCECDHTRCSDVVCPAKYTKKLQSAAENMPGKCCDIFECVPDEGPSDVCVDPQTGLKYDSGEFWQRDPCTPCTCFSGAPQCYNNPCPRATCANPVKMENECCPRCPDEEQCGAFKCDLDCSAGYTLDSRACPLCHCQNDSTCPKLNCEKDCLFGFKTGSDGCEKCECHTCQDNMKHCTLSCGYGFEKDTRGCTLCKCKKDSFGSTMPPERSRCYENGEIHEEDDTWHPNHCTSCTCYSGRSVCSFIDCEHLLGCKNTVTLPKTCCPVCKDGCVDSNAAQRKEGETWIDDCKTCTCYNGTSECKAHICPPLQCKEAVVVPGKCCPICPTVMQNVVTEAEQKYVIVIVAKQDLHTMMERQNSFLKHLQNGNEFTFTLKLLFSSDIRLLRAKSSSSSKFAGCVALVNAVLKNEKGFVLANKVVSQLDHKELMMVEPDVIDILTYSEYLDLSAVTAATTAETSRVSVGAIVGAAIASLIIAVLLVLYGTRRYMILSHRRKFKHSASMGASADQLIHTVDASRLTINFSRTRPSMDSELSVGSPTPSDLSPASYQPVPIRGHDNFASQYNPLSQVSNAIPEAEDPNS